MLVNTVKTKLVIFGAKPFRSKFHNRQIKMGALALEEQQSYQYLGTTLNPPLKLNLHAQKKLLLVGNAFELSRHKENLASVARPTRKNQAPLLILHNYKKYASCKALPYRAAVLWNNLPLDVRNASTKKIFING